MSDLGCIQDLFDVKTVDRHATFQMFYNYDMPLGLGDVSAHVADYINGQILYPPGIHTLPCDSVVLSTKGMKCISKPLISRFDRDLVYVTESDILQCTSSEPRLQETISTCSLVLLPLS